MADVMDPDRRNNSFPVRWKKDVHFGLFLFFSRFVSILAISHFRSRI